MKNLLSIKAVVFFGVILFLLQSVSEGVKTNESNNEVAIVSNMVMNYPAINKVKYGDICNYVIPGFPLVGLKGALKGVPCLLEKVVFCDINDDRKFNDEDYLLIVPSNQANIFKLFQTNPPLIFVYRKGVFNKGFLFPNGEVLLSDLGKKNVINEKEVRELENFFDYICIVTRETMIEEMKALLGVLNKMDELEKKGDHLESPKIFRDQ
jgi:hypothetical protein